MEIKFLNQPKDIKFIDVLSEKLRNKDFSKVWIVAGFTKDSALDCIIEDIGVARENGASVECVFGLDKKNTSKDMLLKYLNLGCHIRYHLNDEGAKLESRLFAFENVDGESYVYITGGKFSEGGISSNLTLIEEIIYSKDEKIEFSKVKAAIENGISNEEFDDLTEEKLKELAATGDIVARITERKIPSISQLYSQTDGTASEESLQEYDEGAESNYKDLLEKEVDIAIDLDESIKVQDSLGEEVEHKLKTAPKEKEEVISKIVGNEKEINYDMMNTLIIPISKPTENGTEIKITSAITSNMFKFIGYPDGFHPEEDEKGNIRELKTIKIEIYDSQNNSQTEDEEAQLIQTIKYTIFKSDKFSNINIEDDDILRLIKNEDGSFRCEFIKQGSNEYEIWNGFCKSTCKGTTKKFGIM